MPSHTRIQASRKPSSSEASIAKEPPGETNGKSWDSELSPPKKNDSWLKNPSVTKIEKKTQQNKITEKRGWQSLGS